jgi:hypothetical protein
MKSRQAVKGEEPLDFHLTGFHPGILGGPDVIAS